MSLPYELVPLTAAGQIQQGDAFIFTDSDGKVKARNAELVLNPGTAEEEVVYKKRGNLYFITALVLDGKSYAKNVSVVRRLEGSDGG